MKPNSEVWASWRPSYHLVREREPGATFHSLCGRPIPRRCAMLVADSATYPDSDGEFAAVDDPRASCWNCRQLAMARDAGEAEAEGDTQ